MSQFAKSIYQRSGPGAPAPKPEPDLSTRQVAREPEPKPDLQSHTPAEQPIRAFTLNDLPQWGPWLLSKLTATWPHIDAFSMRTRLAQMISDNETVLLIANNAVGAATMHMDPLEIRPYVKVIFCWSRSDRGDADVVALLRSFEMWGRLKGAKELRPGEYTELTASRMKENFQERSYFYRSMDKK